MSLKIKRSDAEIFAVLSKANTQEEIGRSRWPGMIYEQGIKDALSWVFGFCDDNPMES